VGTGRPAVGQKLYDVGQVLAPGTRITGFLGGEEGAWNWSVNIYQTVPIELMTTDFWIQAQIQPMTYRDLQQLDGLNIEGLRWKIYMSGQLDGVIRKENKGGDIVQIAAGRHRGEWLVAQVLEQWKDWVCAAVTFQGRGTSGAPTATDIVYP
jgi:hypothetical protein